MDASWALNPVAHRTGNIYIYIFVGEPDLWQKVLHSKMGSIGWLSCSNYPKGFKYWHIGVGGFSVLAFSQTIRP